MGKDGDKKPPMKRPPSIPKPPHHPPPPPPPPDSAPGDGLRSMKTSAAFRALNFELYTRPVSFYSILLR